MARSHNSTLINSTSLPKKKSGWKVPVLVIGLVLAAFFAIWFGQEYFADETVIERKEILLDNTSYTLVFSEKVSGSRRRTEHEVEQGILHYAYFLELIDATASKSLDKIRFTSPVSEIQNTPVMVPMSDGTVWIISTTNMPARDTPGFILKFKIREEHLEPEAFVLDDVYHIRDLDEHKVFLSDGPSYAGPNSFFGNIYLDLETENVIDGRITP